MSTCANPLPSSCSFVVFPLMLSAYRRSPTLSSHRGLPLRAEQAASSSGKSKKQRKKEEEQSAQEFVKLAKALQPTPVEVKKSPEQIRYERALWAIYNKNEKREHNKYKKIEQRMIDCRRAAIAALPTEALRLEALDVKGDPCPFPEEYMSAYRLLTWTPPIPGCKDIFEADDRTEDKGELL